jgi:mono/diheme cytochrome c family protein
MKKTTVGLLVFAIAAIFPAGIFAADDGADLFKTKCAICHGPKGNARTPVAQKQNLRDLASAEVQKRSDADLVAMISEGGEAKKPAHAFRNKGLSDTQIQLLVSFIRSLPTGK